MVALNKRCASQQQAGSTSTPRGASVRWRSGEGVSQQGGRTGVMGQRGQKSRGEAWRHLIQAQHKVERDGKGACVCLSYRYTRSTKLSKGALQRSFVVAQMSWCL